MLQSSNYAPPPDLAPFVRQFYVFRAALPDEFTVEDTLVSESAMVRILLAGHWSARFPGGDWRSEGPILLFGANSRGVRVRVTGAFVVVGFALRPSGWAGLFRRPAEQFSDEMTDLSHSWTDGIALHRDIVAAGEDDAEIVELMIAAVRKRLSEVGTHAVDTQLIGFEDIARSESTTRVADAAQRLRLSNRALERRCRATFGMTPKAVLRRSRFLDMAAAMRGLTDPGEEERAALRFSDQSHMNREFRHFLDMTPGQFERAQTPLLDAGLKLRADGLS